MPRLNSTTLLLSTLLLADIAMAQRVCAEDPYADPRNDPCNVLKYIPSIPANVAAAGLYLLVAIGLTVQQFRYRARWFTVLTIGAYAEAVGLALRMAVRQQPQTLGPYVAMNLVVVLSPCLFLAADYILLGHLVTYLDAAEHLRPLKPRLISRLFVASDIVTFLIQGAGGGLAASASESSGQLGTRLFLVGLALQLASFVLFTCLWAVFGFRTKRNDPYLWRAKGWKTVYWALGFTCIFFLIRSAFRTVELTEGFSGHLTTHEPYFLLLDTLPLFIGITTYLVFWPGKYMVHDTTFQHSPLRNRGMSGASDSSDMNLTPYGQK
ncbi:hypothetical protein IAU60_003008 [Kwoniella sp. DSM 27419]